MKKILILLFVVTSFCGIATSKNTSVRKEVNKFDCISKATKSDKDKSKG
jgi:hypothetical protein